MKLAHTMIRVRDLDATLGFYRDFIGLEENWQGKGVETHATHLEPVRPRFEPLVDVWRG